MLRIYWIEILIRTLPETLLMVLGIYILFKKKLDAKKYILSSIFLSLSCYMIRLLPIHFGIHTIINTIIFIIVMITIGIPVIKAIYGVLLMYFFLSFSEFLNLALLQFLNIDVGFGGMDPVRKNILGIPSLVIFALCILITHYLLKMKRNKKLA